MQYLHFLDEVERGLACHAHFFVRRRRTASGGRARVLGLKLRLKEATRVGFGFRIYGFGVFRVQGFRGSGFRVVLRIRRVLGFYQGSLGLKRGFR